MWVCLAAQRVCGTSGIIDQHWSLGKRAAFSLDYLMMMYSGIILSSVNLARYKIVAVRT